ncbi:MAG TPA: Nre family DNA repair protein [Methanofastidiosum sp.]|nr:Nre family DNA repair protein [Methanofastidiosum sp.]
MHTPKTTLCTVCRGHKKLCGRGICPILEKKRIRESIAPLINKDIFGASPSAFFVGDWNYPKVLVGPLVPPVHEDTEIFDLPEGWHGKALDEIIKFRSLLVRSKEFLKVTDAKNPKGYLEKSQEIVMSRKPIDVELVLKKVPHFALEFSQFSPPTGPSGFVESFKIAENPKVPRVIDKINSDDIKASKGIYLLYDKDIPVSHISKLLSAGLLGEQKNRKLVPTRWSITATDDSLSKFHLKKVKSSPEINKFEVYYDEDVGNRFVVFLFPSMWCYEFLECWLPGSLFLESSLSPNVISDHELFDGRKEYASLTAGAYYAARFSVTEHLFEKGRQAGALVFMEVHPTYHTPVGVWRVREITRNALQKKPDSFDTEEEALKKASEILSLSFEKYREKSKILGFKHKQKTLFDWITP